MSYWNHGLWFLFAALLCALPGILCPELAHSGTFTAWGPQVYQRGTAGPVPVLSSFSISNPSASYTLKIYNGGRPGLQTGERVSSAVISLNGAVIVGPQNFNEKITEIGFPVKLLASNQLSVELRSRPGSLVVVEIVGLDNALPLLNFTAPTGLVIMGSGAAPAKLSVQYSDALSGLDLSSLRIRVDGIELAPYYIGPSSADCLLLALSGGTHTAIAEIRDYAGNQATATLAFEVDNMPVPNAGPDQTLYVGNTAQLDGSSSSDVDGDLLRFQWSFVSRPAGSLATVFDPMAVKPTFVIDKPGSYELQLIVNDGQVDSLPDTVIISTQNSKPVANAGPDQTVPLGGQVFLNGRASQDVDGDPLTYRWRLVTQPPSSTAVLEEASTLQPSFIADKPGAYAIELIVNDGAVESDPDQVVITTENSRPVADAGPDQEARVGDLVQLDGSGQDADNDPLTYQWSFTVRPDGSTAALSDATVVNPTFVPDLPGLYVVQLIVSDGKANSKPDTASITIFVPAPPNRNPVAVNEAFVIPQDTALIIPFPGNNFDPDGDPIAIVAVSQGANGTVTYSTLTTSYTPNPAFHGIDSFTYSIADNRGGTATATVTVTVDQPPQVNAGPDQTITLPATANLAGAVTDDGLPNSPGTVTTQWTMVSGPGTVSFGNALAANTTASFSQAGSYGLRLTASDGYLSASDDVQITVNPAPPSGPPPDPATVAPPLDRSVANNLAKATEFLYSGANPIQTGVATGTIEPKRAAVLRGRVMARDESPLPGVTITILNHPEYGQTLSRADGMFDMAVNGGGYLTVSYSKPSYLPAQRQINVPWQDYVWLPDVIMIPVDTQVTTVDLTGPDPFKVARGSVVTDKAGPRQATLLFPSGTTATIVNPDGTSQQISTLNVRATEYSIGPNGPKAMPAELPPTSGYTHAVELSADEAISAGVNTVQFSQPIFYYIENYLNAKVGSIVPVGYYDRAKGVWIPSDNGKVIKIVDITGGLAQIDTDGDGVADNGLGITDAERQRLATLYAVGQTLWRVPISHLTPWDCNWPYGPPPDAKAPKQPPPKKTRPKCEDEEGGSIIGCQTQTLGEAISIAGTPFRLHYQSDRVQGWKDAYTLEISLSGDTVPDSLLRIELEIYVAGRKFTQSLFKSYVELCPCLGPLNQFPVCPPCPSSEVQGNVDSLTNLKYVFRWDGKDAYGRSVQGLQAVAVRIGYTYWAVYDQAGVAFAAFSGVPITGSRALGQFTLWQEWKGFIGPWDARGQGLDGWSLSIHHAYDPVGQALYLGNGDRRAASDMNKVITTVAGNGFAWIYNIGDGGPATDASLNQPAGVAVGPDGSIYIADMKNYRIRRVAPDGIITTFAGTGTQGYCWDEGPATDTCLYNPQHVAVGPDGSLFITEDIRIKRVRPDGIIGTFAGASVPYGGDGGPATNAGLGGIGGIAVGSDGSLYISSFGYNTIRKVGPDGIITTIAGTAQYGGGGYSGDGGPATSALLKAPGGVAIGPDGSLYIADGGNYRVRRVGPDGVITSIAGTGVAGFSGDGGPAADATFKELDSIALGPEGNIYIGDGANHRIRLVTPVGIINTIAGAGEPGLPSYGYSGDGGPAANAKITIPYGVAVGPDGSAYIADLGNHRIRRVGSIFPGVGVSDITIPSEDGSAIYVFSSTGKHIRTVHTLTGSILYQFGYDAGGLLTTITDGYGNITTIDRDSAGNPTDIVAPFSQRTALSMNPNGYLASLANPAGETYQFNYTSDGLLTSLTDPKGFVHTFTYDSLGLLTKDENPAGGSHSLSRTETRDGFQVNVTTAMGRNTSYLVENLSSDDQRLTNTYPDGTQTKSVLKTDGSTALTLPDGTVVNSVAGPDPRFGMQSPLLKSLLVTTPGGLGMNVSENRTVTLTDPSNPLSLSTLTDTFTKNGQTYTSAYNAATKTFMNTTPVGRQGTTTLDSLGHITQQQVSGLNALQYSYDSKGRISGMTQGSGPDAKSYIIQYNSQGYLNSITDPLSNVLSFEYDLAGRVIMEILQDGGEINYTYDSNGNVTSISPPGRPAHLFTYNTVDLMREYAPPDVGLGTGSIQYTYNADRQITQLLKPDGQTIGFSYDTEGHLSGFTSADGPMTYTYDPAKGYLTGMSWPGGSSFSYTYDGELTTGETLTGDISGLVSWTYDNDFRVAGVIINGGNIISYLYDNDGLITQAGDLTLGRSPQNGFLTGTTLGNVSDSRGYNSFGEPSNYLVRYNASEIFNQQFTYDKIGRITNKTETIDGVTKMFTYLYDMVGHLTTVKENNVTTATYTYDSNGNRLNHTGPGGTASYTYDAQDRLTTQSSVFGTQSYEYNANGELVTKTAGAQTTQYSYDAFGNLKRVNLPNGDIVEYTVDGRGRRIGKKVNGTWVQKFLYLNQLKPFAELDASNAIVSRFIYGSRRVVPDYMIRGEKTYRIISDHLGSPRLVIDITTGTVVQRMDYDEFGNVISDTNPGFQPFGFAGGLHDRDTKFVHFGKRDYDADIGRWAVRDPVLFGGNQMNLYSYVDSDPANFIDPTGTSKWRKIARAIVLLCDLLKPGKPTRIPPPYEHPRISKKTPKGGPGTGPQPPTLPPGTPFDPRIIPELIAPLPVLEEDVDTFLNFLGYQRAYSL